MKCRTKRPVGLVCALVLPLLFMGLFHLLKGSRAVMDAWVFGVMGPAEQFLGRLWSVFPFSVAEVLAAVFLLGGALWLVLCVVQLLRGRIGAFARRLMAFGAVCLWLLAGLDWLWNAGYYASDLSQRMGLEADACSVEELHRVTALFADAASDLACQVERDGDGHFAVSYQECLDRGVSVYSGIVAEIPGLDIPPTRAKPLICSRLQSILGFTGVYFPFTGEANVNVDAPTCLLPATIAHEMAHQRMVAAEEEANFAAIAACITSDDVLFQYSGYLMGLIHLSNALYSAQPQLWYDIRAGFSPQLVTDWNDNNTYWEELRSPVEEAAGSAYDSFLKGNDQSLGMRSYGACVDLLVAWMADGR